MFSNQKMSHFLKWQYRAGAGEKEHFLTGAGANIKDKVEPKPELEPKLNNLGSATLAIGQKKFLAKIIFSKFTTN